MTVAALGGGCSGDDAEDRPASARDRAFDGALKFARCMREHGVDLPDPQRGPNGMVKMGPGPGEGGRRLNPEDPKFAAADKACRKHLEETGGPDTPMPEEHRDAFVAYARCMREQGIDNMPDPAPDGGIRFRVGDPNAPKPESPAFKKADGVCHKHLAAVDKALGREESP